MISDLSNGGENNVVDRTVTQNYKKNKTEVVINWNDLFFLFLFFLKEVSLSISDKMVNLCTGLVTSLEEQS